MFGYNPIHKEKNFSKRSPEQQIDSLIKEGYINNLVQVDSEVLIGLMDNYIQSCQNIGQIIIAFVKLFISGDRDISLAIFVICMAVILLALSLMKFKAYA